MVLKLLNNNENKELSEVKRSKRSENVKPVQLNSKII